MSESTQKALPGRTVSEDDIDQFKKLRELSSPTAQAAATNEFGKWLFASVGTVTGLALAFATPNLAKLAGDALTVTALAVLLVGMSLSTAAWLLATGLSEVNYQSLSAMQEEWKTVLGKKRKLAKVSGLSFATALVLAALAPLMSTEALRRAKVPVAGSWQFSIGEESAKFTGRIVGLPQSQVQYGAVAVGKSGSRHLFGGIGEMPESGVFEVSGLENAIVATDTGVEIWFQCLGAERKVYSIVLQPPKSYTGADSRTWAIPSCSSK